MGDRMTAAELGAVKSRIVGDVPAAPAGGLHERMAARQLAEAIRAGDPGPVRAQLAGLRASTASCSVEPWRLLAELADLQVQQTAAVTPA